MSAEQIAADLTDRIARGEYKAGDQLPTYETLASLYNVSTGTIARVMIVLRTRGTVVGVPGRGVFVPDAPR
jgi:DNA-binding GntR family transcriptional regulator